MTTAIPALPSIEQVAFSVPDIDAAVRTFRANGVHEWVRDTVTAAHLFVRPEWTDAIHESTFTVRLAFNYIYLPGLETELIESTHGQTVQLLEPGTLSHLGYHVPENDPNDRLIFDLWQWQAERNCPVLQVSQTIKHSGTSRRYRYAFVDTRRLFRGFTKVIQRIPPDLTVDAGRETFAWLRS